MTWKALSKQESTESIPIEQAGWPLEQRQWVLRYKHGNHPAATGLILASSSEKAEEVGRAWCTRKSVGILQQVRFIAVEDPVLADETILEN